MAFTSRARRDIDLSIGCTPITIGPGSYPLKDKINKKETMKFSRAPFSSTSRRRGSFSTDVPGPGAYSIQVQRPRSVSSVFQSRTDRFRQEAEKANTPGPGSYTPWMKSKPVNRGAQALRQEEYGQIQPLLNLPRTPPSIPARSQSHGYVEQPDGRLARQAPPSQGQTNEIVKDRISLGEAEMQNRDGNYRASACFSSSTSRDLFANLTKSATPGPGYYESANASAIGASIDSFSKSAIFASTTRRTDWTAKKDDFPAPGVYGSDTAFKKYFVPRELQGFGSRTGRMGDSDKPIEVTPGPGHYVEHERVSWKPKFTGPRGAFNSTAKRFKQDVEMDEKPAPGTYEIAGFVCDISKRSNVGSYGVFGTTSKRFKEVGSIALGPGVYDPKPVDKIFKPRKRDTRTSAFMPSKNATPIKKPNLTTPGPGQYNLRSSWDQKDNRTSRNDGLFFGSTRRFNSMATRNANIPGPGAYHPKDSYKMIHDKSTRNRYSTTPFLQSSKRFGSRCGLYRTSTEAHVGPGAYSVESPWIKRSYNATIETQF